MLQLLMIIQQQYALRPQISIMEDKEFPKVVYHKGKNNLQFVCGSVKGYLGSHKTNGYEGGWGFCRGIKKSPVSETLFLTVTELQGEYSNILQRTRKALPSIYIGPTELFNITKQ